MTLSKLKYRFLSTVISIFVFFSNYKFKYSNEIDMEKLMDKAIDFSSISFGFLLAVLALLLQNNSPALKRIIEAGKFSDLIKSNKKAVVASAILAIVALMYISLRLYLLTNVCFDINIELLSESICLCIFSFQIVELILFLDLFYFIIKQDT